MQGELLGVAVKIVSDEQERPTILGTARVPRGASDFNDELKTIHFSLNKYAGVAELADAPDLGNIL